MKKTKAAVKYGMEVLKLSPDELFKLIESSQGYNGEEYARWLASKIIEVAEDDGVLFSQLLVKKFNIINEILEEVSENQELREEFLDIFRSCLHKDLYTVDVANVGNPLEVDWFHGLDLDEENSFFVEEKLPVELRDKILENKKLSFLVRLGLDSPDKKSDLYSYAKGQSINIQSSGALMLFRLCMMINSFDMSNTKIGLLVPTKFLYEEDNCDIINYVLAHFKVEEGFCIKSIELSTNALNAGDMAFITVSPRFDEDEEQDGVLLTSIKLDEDSMYGYEELCVKRYSRSYSPMLNYIAEESPSLVDEVNVQSLGKVSGTGKGYKDALGYLNINGSISLTTLPEEGKRSIAITTENIKDIIAYYGVTVSRESEWGYSSDIQCLIDGISGYEELLYNCLPLFLFDYNSEFKNIQVNDVKVVKNKLDIIDSEIVNELLDIGTPYFSFEAKELFNICKEYIEYSKDNIGVSGKSFKELREMSDNKDFNNLYESRLANLKDYVNTMCRKFL